jgi:DNA-binding beta-propeller fold protein YncE
VQISDALVNVFLGAGNIVGGATGVVGRASTAPTIEEPRPGADIVYIGSSTENRVQTFTVGRPVNDPAPYLLPGNFFLLDGIDVNYGNSTETRGMQFSKDGNRLYVVNRRPPSLSIFDTSLGPTQVPRNVQTGSTDICRQASTVAVLGFGENGQEDAVEGERAYVTCFQDGELYVVDPRGQSQVEDVLTVGRGPYSVVAVDAVGAPRRLFISNFLEDTIAVVDVDPQSPSRNRVVLRIGEPKSLESL